MSAINNNMETFNNIYINNVWGNGSGPGSYIENVKPWVNAINSVIKEKNISSVLDLGCGDGQWLNLLPLDKISYIGIDASELAISLNKSKNHLGNLTFIHDDLVTADYPKVDLIIIKDVLQHLPYDMIKSILSKIKTGCRYALFCEDFSNSDKDINAGEWRGINLMGPKFDIELEFIDSYKLPHIYKECKHIYMYSNDSRSE